MSMTMNAAVTAVVGGTIDERAMLVDLNISHWKPIKTDEKVSREIAATHGTTRDVGNYRKKLFDSKSLSAIRSIVREAYLYHINVTMPWLDNGVRILPAASFFEYEKRFRDIQSRLNTAVDAFVDGYPQLLNEAQRSLNSMYNPDDYPPTSEIRQRFDISYKVLPVPTASDFRVQLSGADVDRIKKQIDATTQAAIADATRDVYTRVVKTVGHMAERLRAYSVSDSGVENAFRDSLVDNVRELVGLLPALNITNDPALTNITTRMRDELTTYDGDTLRASAAARIETARAAEDILSAVSEFMS